MAFPQNRQQSLCTTKKKAWDKSKNYLYMVLIAIVLGVSGVSFYNQSENRDKAERSLRYLTASSETEGAEERFLSFSEDYNDKLGGLAQYQAAVIQYKDARYEEAAKNFDEAAKRLAGNPLQGRVLLGYAVSLVKQEGKRKMVKRHSKPLPIIAMFCPQTVLKQSICWLLKRLRKKMMSVLRSIAALSRWMKMPVRFIIVWKN